MNYKLIKMKLRPDLRKGEVGSASRNSLGKWRGLRAPGINRVGSGARVLRGARSRNVSWDRGTCAIN